MEPVIKDNQIKDKKDTFVSLKAEKLASALYLVSDFLSDAEPLKWQLRERALGVINNVVNKHWWQVLSYIDQLVPLLIIAATNPAVSASNFTILKDEYQALRQVIVESQINFTSYFQLPAPAVIEASAPRHNNQTGALSKPIKSPGPASNDQSRQEIILAFIRQQSGWSSISEIAKALPGFSSKTVQRELLRMVKDGVLKKEGSKRWSRYITA